MSTKQTLTKEALATVIGASTDVNPIIVTAKTVKANKTNLITRLLECDDIESKAEAGRILDNILDTLADIDQTPSKAVGTRVTALALDTIKDALTAGNDVTLSGFVNMTPRIQAAKPARDGHNPATGAAIKIPATPAKNTVSTKLTAPFKRALNV